MDFPKKTGVTADEVWAAADRSLNSDANNAVRDAVLSDATPFAGGNIDGAITSRAAPADILKNPANLVDGDRIDKIAVDTAPDEGTLVSPAGEQTVIEKDFTASPKVARLEGQIDLSAMVGGDTVVIRQSVQIRAAGGYVKYNEETYTGAQSTPLLRVDTNWARYKIKVTIQKTAGADHSYDWQFFTRQQA